ncbi:MAG: hypothetical protein WD075_00955 [Rhodospirillales bacterium]
MALEVSIIGSAQRLQEQRDQRVELARVQQREEALANARNAERVAQSRQLEAQIRADIIANDQKQARIELRDFRDATDAAQYQAVRDRALDNRFDDIRFDQEQADLRYIFNQQRALSADLQARDNTFQPLTDTAPPALTVDDVTAASATGVSAYEQLISDRNSRLADKAEADRLFADAQSRDFSRSVRAVDDLRDNPSALPGEPPRGSVVDFRA